MFQTERRKSKKVQNCDRTFISLIELSTLQVQIYSPSAARTCPAGGVHLAGQRFQMHFLRLLAKLKNWEKWCSKAQKKLKMYVRLHFLELPLVLLTWS